MNTAGWKFQFGLGWGAYAILVCALGLGWYRAHSQAAHDQERLSTDVVVMDKQIAALTQQIEGDRYSSTQRYLRFDSTYFTPLPRLKVKVPESAEAFIQQLESLRQDRRPLPYDMTLLCRLPLFQLYEAPDGMFHQAMPALMRFSKVPESPVREATLRIFQGLTLKQRSRMAPHIPILVDTLIERLGDADDRVRIAAAQTLEAVGPDADSALQRLKKIEADKDDKVAVFAVLAIGAIDPQYDTVSRLETLIENQQSDWKFAVEYLPEILLADEAERVLKRLLLRTNVAEVNEILARTLSRLERQQRFAQQETTP